MKRWVPWATLLLLLVTVGSYIYFSGGQPYVHPISKMDSFGVSGRNLFGAFSYAFMHIGLKHLIGNAVVLLVMGVVLERRIGKWHTLGLYLTAAIGSGILYAILHPAVWVVGASAAISGLIIAAYIADLKKSAVIMVIALLAIPTVIFPLTDYGLDMFQEEKTGEHAAAVVGLNQLEMEMREIEIKVASAQIPEEEKQVLEKALEEKQLALAQKEREVEETRLEEVSVAEGRRTEAVTPVSIEIHLIGILFTLLYLVLLKREAFSWLKRDLLDIIEPRNKQSRGRTEKRRRKALPKVSKTKRRRVSSKAKRH